MSGIVGSFVNHRGSGIVAKFGTDGHSFNSAGAGIKAVTEAVSAGGDLSFGGDTFGENKIVGANDAYSLSLETNGTTALTISSDGEITQPLQPGWGGGITAASNVTGDRTTYTMGAGETFDLGGDFSSSTFTAPVAGNYLLSCHLALTQVDGGHSRCLLQLVTSNRTHNRAQSGANYADASTNEGTSMSLITDMDASDTAIIKIFIGHPGPGGDGDKTVDIVVGWFSGTLIT